MRWIAVITVILFSFSGSAMSQDDKSNSIADNTLLKRLFDADQGDRKNGTIDQETVKRDADRQKQVLAELRSGRIRTADDHYHAAMVFQHGESADDIRLAFSMAWISAQMDPKKKDRSLWLSAAAWDRIMMREDMPQWYGTQYVADDNASAFRLYRLDETAATDEERLRFKVPILSEAKKRVETLNRTLLKKSDEQTHAPENAKPVESKGQPPARSR